MPTESSTFPSEGWWEGCHIPFGSSLSMISAFARLLTWVPNERYRKLAGVSSFIKRITNVFIFVSVRFARPWFALFRYMTESRSGTSLLGKIRVLRWKTPFALALFPIRRPFSRHDYSLVRNTINVSTTFLSLRPSRCRRTLHFFVTSLWTLVVFVRTSLFVFHPTSPVIVLSYGPIHSADQIIFTQNASVTWTILLMGSMFHYLKIVICHDYFYSSLE